MNDKKKYSFTEWRIIGISLAVLSFGLAIAYFGLFWGMRSDTSDKNADIATASGELK